MKIALMILRLLLPAAAIVLAALSMKQTGDARMGLMGGGMICLGLSTALNLYCLRRDRKEREKEQP